MQVLGGQILFSASDVVDACVCGHLPVLERARAAGRLAFRSTPSPEQEMVARHAALHEQRAFSDLAPDGDGAVIPADLGVAEAAALTLQAMADGARIVRHGVLLQVPWVGRPDFLVRVSGGSRFGPYQYEAVDARLARQARGEALVQGAVHSLLLGEAQGAVPEHLHLWLGTGEMATYATRDCTAYAELARRRLRETAASLPEAAPDPVPHCAGCRFLPHCDSLRRTQDHLSLLPGIQRRQIAHLQRLGITTLAVLAAQDPERPGGSPATPAVTRQVQLARLRLKERTTGLPCYELRAPESGRGLYRLPEPSPGDVFFDLEGDPFGAGGSLEYLWGWLIRGRDAWRYGYRWAHEPAQERAAFEGFVDMLTEIRLRHPGMHVYHYAAYEVSALQRLMGRHGTREEAMDGLLRGQAFVDLYRVAYEALLVSRESYSIKDLEPLYLPGEREAGVKTASGSIVTYDLWKSSRDASWLEQLRAYNEEDCRSTEALRGWLEALRAEAGDTERPAAVEGAPSEAVHERDLALAQVAATVEGGPPDEAAGRAILAGLVHWYRREQRPQWWAYFARQAASDEDLLEDPDCLAGLRAIDRTGDLWTFRFDAAQEYTLRTGDRPCDAATGRPAGSIVALDPARGEVRLRCRQDLSGLRALMPGTPLDVSQQEAALGRVVEAVAESGLSGPGPYRHLRDYLRGALPRFRGRVPGEVLQTAGGGDVRQVATDLAAALDDSTLAVQGPPGTGKTTLAGTVIAALLRQGRTVGVTAQSHKVIGNLLRSIDRALGAQRDGVRGVQRAPAAEGVDLQWVAPARSNGAVLAELERGAQLVAGTAWLFSRTEMDGRLDVLVVDEAGQYSLADAVASGTAARNLILVGDPQQLRQVVQGAHPPGIAVSALEHVLAGRATMPADRGLFLPVTQRLHPRIAAYISDVAYEGRLRAAPVCSQRLLEGRASWSETNLVHICVPHEGNRRSSVEEARAVAGVVGDLMRCSFRDAGGSVRPIALDDILIVAPFNAHVQRLAAALPSGARVGTVDRFQGQEAPVVIYSTAASDAEHVPRGMEFLFSLNRLNVAVSRAQVLAVLVGSPQLLSTWSDDPARLQLVNALCRFVLQAAPASGLSGARP